MVLFSVAFEGDRPLQAYPKLAKKAEELGFHSFQIYEHLPHKPAWPIAFLAGSETKRILVGPVTVPVFLFKPITLARNLKALSELTHGRAILGISRGAYAELLTQPVDRSIHEVLETVNSVENLIRDIPTGIRPELYVGTSGPKLAYKSSQLSAVKAIVVDNLWNPKYASRFRGILDEAEEKSHRKEKVSLIARPFTMLAKNKKEAIRKLNPILKTYLPHLAGDSPMLKAGGLEFHELLKACKSKATLPTELINNVAAAGAPDDIIHEIEPMLKSGVDHICFGHPLGSSPTTAMELLAQQVTSHFN